MEELIPLSISKFFENITRNATQQMAYFIQNNSNS